MSVFYNCSELQKVVVVVGKKDKTVSVYVVDKQKPWRVVVALMTLLICWLLEKTVVGYAQ